jgi:hypothetical protein
MACRGDRSGNTSFHGWPVNLIVVISVIPNKAVSGHGTITRYSKDFAPVGIYIAINLLNFLASNQQILFLENNIKSSTSGDQSFFSDAVFFE